jgi:uncharacterized membrane protein
MKIFTIAMVLSAVFFLRPQEEKQAMHAHYSEYKSDLKLEVYKILQVKCNVCHQTKNPSKVFTLDNMTSLAPKIYKQVFITKRMPKGKEIRLSQNEYDKLKKWLLSQNIK